MPAADSPDQNRRDIGRRAISIMLALAVEALIALLILFFGPSEVRLRRVEPRSLAFQMLPSPDAGPAPAKQKRVAKTARAVKSATSAAPPRRPKAVTPEVDRSPEPPGLIVLDKNAFAASDIASLPSHNAGQGSGDDDGTGKDSGSTYGPGEGPGGERLFNARWYREPTDAELAHYLPAKIESGTADIACHTIEDFHVDNCRSLGESPVGSGLARALRQAAWQFRIYPPRLGGHSMVGAWVRIHYDLTVGIAK